MRQTPELGRFRVVRELGRGGMGVVYEVRDPELPGRALALKLLLSASDANTLARFAREAQVLARVRHAGVVGVHAFDRTARGEPYLLTDLVPGRDLVAHVQATGRLAPVAAAALVRDVADAMAAVHAAGVIHRDLKPANVLVRPDGVPVVIDFGLACAADASRLTATGTVMGTVAFMPPEQAGGAVVDARADVYGLGAVLYWLLTGRAPFGGPPVQAMFALLHKEPPWPAEVDPSTPRGLDAICRQAMAKDPADRLADATALRDALARWLAEGEPAAPPRRGRTVVVAGALAALTGALGLAFVAAPEPLPRPPPVVEPTSSIAPVATGDVAWTPSTAAGMDPLPRRTWTERTWDAGGSDNVVQVRFLDDDRLVTLGKRSSSVAVHRVSPDFPGQGPRSLSLTEHGGTAMVKGAPGQVLFVTSECLWSCDGEQVTRCSFESPDGVALTLGAFEWLASGASGEAVVAGRNLLPTLLSLNGPAATVTRTFEPGDHAERYRISERYGMASWRDRVLEVDRVGTRGDGPGILLSWHVGGGPPQTVDLPQVASLAVHPEAPLAAVGLLRGGVVVLFDVSRAMPTELTRLGLDYEQVGQTGTQVHVCTFGAGRLWAGTPHAIWSWSLDVAPFLSGGEPPALGEATLVTVLEESLGVPSSIDVSPDGALIAVGTHEGRVLLRGVDATPR